MDGLPSAAGGSVGGFLGRRPDYILLGVHHKGELGELARVLKPDARLLLCVTNRYGYSESLQSFLHGVKRIPGAAAAASSLRRFAVGGAHGVMRLSFVPRKHRPRELREHLARHGLQVAVDRFAHFTVLPSPLSALANKLTSRIGSKLERLARTPR